MADDLLPPAPFGRMLTAMATAFHEDGSVDLEGTARIAAHLVDHGNDGVVVSGTTGESPTTTVDEDGRILAAVKDAVGDRASVVAGVGTNSTAHSVELAEQAAKIGVDARAAGDAVLQQAGPGRGAAPLPHRGRRHRPAGDALRRAGPHRHRHRPGHLRGGQGAARPWWPSRTPPATWPASRCCRRLGYAVYSGDDVLHPRLPRPRRVRPGLGGRPRRRPRAGRR